MAMMASGSHILPSNIHPPPQHTKKEQGSSKKRLILRSRARKVQVKPKRWVLYHKTSSQGLTKSHQKNTEANMKGFSYIKALIV